MSGILRNQYLMDYEGIMGEERMPLCGYEGRYDIATNGTRKKGSDDDAAYEDKTRRGKLGVR